MQQRCRATMLRSHVRLGVVATGVLADLLLVEESPPQNIPLIAQPEKYFLLIMKDGKFFRNDLKN